MSVGGRSDLFRRIAFILLSAAIVAVDQVVKHWAFTELQKVDTLPIWQDVFHFTFRKNYGAGFSILENERLLLIAVPCALIAVMLYLLLFSRRRSALMRTGISFICGGGAGNLVDRVFNPGGYVVDFADFRLINFAVFNVADAFITIGAVILLVYMVFFDGREKLISKRGLACADGKDPEGGGKP